MMKFNIYLAVLVAAGVSSARLDHLVPQGYAPTGGAAGAQPFRFENINNGDGTYSFSYDTPGGISAHESGAPRAPGPEGPAVTAEGSFSYRAPDGQQISLTYTADEDGFHPSGTHLPTPPPVPQAIQRSLINRQNRSPGFGSFRGGRRPY